ncbi:MAG: hypothetical protein IT249_19410 [Chitinophagaceae bacterium]|nr:hypothetical protein [Chitinophagaceae bacterium]
MTTIMSLQQILLLSATLTKENYTDNINALKITVPAKLRKLIAISEQAPLDTEMRNLVEENVISSYKELLMEIARFNRTPNQPKAKELMNWVRCEIEMGMLFMEGIYKYTSRCRN